MFDINTIVNDAIRTAVAQVTAPLVERIAALETKLTEAKLFDHTTAVTIPVDEARMVEALNSQEWFWEKLATKAKEIADAAAENAIDDHCRDHDHDDYDKVVSAVDDLDLGNVVMYHDLEGAIQEKVEEASFKVKVSF